MLPAQASSYNLFSQIWQCAEGHIMCESCAYRPEMVHCSQCRTPLYGYDGTVKLTRNRALEELARRTFPVLEGESTMGQGRGRGNRGGRCRVRERGGRAAPARVTARVTARMDDEGKDVRIYQGGRGGLIMISSESGS